MDRYLARVSANMRRFVDPAMYAEIERQMDLTRQAPGAMEVALLDRVTVLMEEGRQRHDRVIFDTAPTGHTLRLLALPEIMAAWTEGLLKSRERSDSLGRAVRRLTSRKQGSGDELSWFDDVDDAPEDERSRRIREVLLERRRRFAQARRLLLDSEVTAFLLVLIPEKLPILESEKTLEVLRRHRVPVGGAVVNRVLPNAPPGRFPGESPGAGGPSTWSASIGRSATCPGFGSRCSPGTSKEWRASETWGSTWRRRLHRPCVPETHDAVGQLPAHLGADPDRGYPGPDHQGRPASRTRMHGHAPASGSRRTRAAGPGTSERHPETLLDQLPQAGPDSDCTSAW